MLATLPSDHLTREIIAASIEVHLVINFNVERLVNGVKRVINPRADLQKAARLS